MNISIIVPAFNEERLLAATLQQINAARAAFTRRQWPVEVIVCDNNSTDRTAEIARAAGATVVFEPINQIGRARNRGAEAATGDWLIFVDADSRPSMDLFEDVAVAIESRRFVAGGCTLRLDQRHWLGDFVTGLWNRVSRSRRLVAGSFIFCEAAAFRALGGFSPELFAGEELDLSQRLKTYAAKNQRELVILHRHPLLTSARKLNLYSGSEHLRFILRAAFNHRRTLKDRAACHQWYDGRR